MVSSVVSTEPGTVPCGRRVHVQVPATSANLGPGFDTLGLALARYDVLDIEVVPTGLEIEVHGVGEGVAGVWASAPATALCCPQHDSARSRTGLQWCSDCRGRCCRAGVVDGNYHVHLR